MVDSRSKGQRGEYLVRDLLRKHTKLDFQRVPQSGALSFLKGDLFVPDETNRFCIEVKNYEKSPLTDKVFTNKTNYLVQWWTKIQEQAEARKQEPLLFFKYARSKVFVVTEVKPVEANYFLISWLGCHIMLAEEWLTKEDIKWIGSDCC